MLYRIIALILFFLVYIIGLIGNGLLIRKLIEEEKKTKPRSTYLFYF